MEIPLRTQCLRYFCVTLFCVFALIPLFITSNFFEIPASAEVKSDDNYTVNSIKNSEFSFEFDNFIGFLNYENCFCDMPNHPTYSENSASNPLNALFLDFCLMDGSFIITTYQNLYLYRNNILISTFLNDITATFSLRDYGLVTGAYRLTPIKNTEETENAFYIAIFSLNGGSVESEFNVNQSILVGKHPSYPANLVKVGYDFVKWNISGDTSENAILTISAVWSIKTYQLYVKNSKGELLYQRQYDNNFIITKESVLNFLSVPKYYEDYVLTHNTLDFDKIVIVKDETVFLTVKLKSFNLTILSDNDNRILFSNEFEYNSAVNLKNILIENFLFTLQESQYFIFKIKNEIIDELKIITDDICVNILIGTYTFTAKFQQEADIFYPTGFRFVQILPLHLQPELPKENPTKIGHQFVEFLESGEKISGGIVYYQPQFFINSYTLTIYDDDKLILVKKLNYGCEFILLSELFVIQDGYQLLGFSYLLNDVPSIYINEAITLTHNLILYFVNTVKEFDVTLFIDDELHLVVKIKYGEAFKGYQPRLENMVFLYWKDSLGNRITGDLIIYKDINLYAELYVPIAKYKLTINIDKNIIIKTDIFEEYERNSEVKINFKVESGYQVKATECDFNGIIVPYTLTESDPYHYTLAFIFPLSDSVLTLISSPKSYFMGCYKSIDDLPFNEAETFKYQYKDNITFPTQIGYNASYYKDINKTIPFDLTTMPVCDKQDLLMYVHFTPKMVKVNLISITLNDIIEETLMDFDDVSKPSSNEYYEIETAISSDRKTIYYFWVRYGSSLENFKIPSSSIVGHSFIGWSQRPFSDLYYGENIVEDISLYPLFEKNDYIVSFLSDDLTFFEIKYTFLEKITSPQIEPTKVGHKFSHWSGLQTDDFCTNNVQFNAVFDIESYEIIADFFDTQVDCVMLPSAMYNSSVKISATAKEGFVVNQISLYNNWGKKIDVQIENYGMGLFFIMPPYDIVIKIQTSGVSNKNIVKSQTDIAAGVSFAGNIDYITNHPPVSYGEYIMEPTVDKLSTPGLPSNILSSYNLNYSLKFDLTFKHIYNNESSIVILGNGGYAIIDIFIANLNSESHIKIFEKNGDAYLEISKTFDNDSKKVTVAVKNQTVYYILILNDDTSKVGGLKIFFLCLSSVLLPIIVAVTIHIIKKRKRIK